MVDLIDMGGHGAFVWPAYAISLATLAALFIVRRRQLNRALKKETGANENPSHDSPD